MRCLVVAMVIAASAGWAQGPAQPEAARPMVTIEGTVERIQAQPGLGMPYLDVAQTNGATRVWLGSMRYLVHNNFNPIAGETVRVEGFRQGDRELLAKKVTLSDRGQSLDLRDEAGRPLWQRGRHGHRRGAPPQQPGGVKR